MRQVTLFDGPIEWRNAFDFDHTGAGSSPRRLPAWTRPQIPDLMVEAMVRMGSGVRLAFRTNASAVELDVMLTSFRFDGEARRTHGFDLVVDGAVHAQQSTDGGTCFVLDPVQRTVVGVEEGSALTLRWAELGTDTKEIEIWLPTAATCEVRALRVDPAAEVDSPTKREAPSWVHYGSSISHCMEVVHPTETWPALAARALGVELTSLALAGQCHLDPFVARTIRNLEPDVISVKVGINIINLDSMRERIFTPTFHGFIDTIRERCPATPLLVVSPIFCPSAEDRPGPTVPDRSGKFRVVDAPDELRVGSLTLRRIREILATAVAERREAGDEHLHHLDGLALFDRSDWEAGDLPDDLHPNPAGYRRMAERFVGAVGATVFAGEPG